MTCFGKNVSLVLFFLTLCFMPSVYGQEDCNSQLINVQGAKTCNDWCEGEGIFLAKIVDNNVWSEFTCTCDSGDSSSPGKSCTAKYEMPTCQSVGLTTCSPADSCQTFCDQSDIGINVFGPNATVAGFCEENIDAKEIKCACGNEPFDAVVACDDGGASSSGSATFQVMSTVVMMMMMMMAVVAACSIASL